MDKLSEHLNDVMRNNSHNGGIYPHVAASEAKYYIEKIAIEFANYVDNGSKWDVGTKEFNEFLRQKYK